MSGDDIWTDIEPVNPVAREKLGYPTQKPEALLERIIRASSDLLFPYFHGYENSRPGRELVPQVVGRGCQIWVVGPRILPVLDPDS